MASASHRPVSLGGNLVSRSSASDLLRGSSNGVFGVPLKTLGRVQFGAKKREVTVRALFKKPKKKVYPEPDPNLDGADALMRLSTFQPLKEQRKPIILDFERPLMQIRKEINQAKEMSNKTGLDFSQEIAELEEKHQKEKERLHNNLTPIQRVYVARHPHRPTFLDHVFNMTEKFVELHGDRAGYDDPAIVTGLGTINGRTYMFIGHQKGRNSKENVYRNFGMPTPHGFRKALRMMEYADHHGFPIVTFVDTPGAFADLKSEGLGQGEAIARNLRSMFGLKVPVISIVIGEGGSGGALAIACGNKLLMLENAVFYVASPEACAAIVWRTAKAAPKAARRLRITGDELCKLQIADGVIPEPIGGAHADPYNASQEIKRAILKAMNELDKMDTEELLKQRYLKFRNIGRFEEGAPIDPIKKVNMKLRDPPESQHIFELENLEVLLTNARESIAKNPESGLNELIERLETEVKYEIFEAARAIGFMDKADKMGEELTKANDSKDFTKFSALKVELDKLQDDFGKNLSSAPNYRVLKLKLDILEGMSKAKDFTERKKKEEEINKRFQQIVNRPDIKQRIKALKAKIEELGASSVDDLDAELKKQIAELKKEMDSEFAASIKSLGAEIVSKSEVAGLEEEIDKAVEHVVSSSDLKHEIEMLKSEIAKAEETPDAESKAKIDTLSQQIKDKLAESEHLAKLERKYKKLMTERASSRGSNGSLIKGSKGKDGKSSGPKVNRNAEAKRT